MDSQLDVGENLPAREKVAWEEQATHFSAFFLFFFFFLV